MTLVAIRRIPELESELAVLRAELKEVRARLTGQG